MKSREERKKFEESLSALIKKHNSRTDFYNKIIEELDEKLGKGKIARIWSGNMQPMFLLDVELLLFSQVFYELIKDTKEGKSINPHNIFTDNEFDESLHVMVSPENIKKDSITFKDVTRVYQKKIGYIYHIPAVNCSQIADMSNNNIINYNFLAQREAVVKEVFGEEIKIPKIFPEKVDSIAEKILDGSYYPVDTIVINVLKTGREKIDYDETRRELTLYKVEGSTNDEIDGANRIQAITKAYTIAKQQNKELEVNFKVDILNVPLRNSNDCIIQINNQTRIEEDRVKSLEPSKYMKIVKDINIYENEEVNILYDKLGESLKEYNVLNKYSTVQVFSDGLKENFKDILEENNPSAYLDILEYQVSFFNNFLGEHFNTIKDVENAKKQTVLLDINMFYFYIYISKKLYELKNENEKEWRKKVKKIANDMDFNKENKDWENLRTTGKLSVKAKEQLINYFDNTINNVLKENEMSIEVSK